MIPRMFKFLSFLFLFSYARETAAATTFHFGSVYCKTKQCTFRPNVLDRSSATAFGTFNDTLLTSGWGILDISAGHGNVSVSNTDIMFAAGFVEGVLTARQMDAHYKNLRTTFLPPSKEKVFEKLKDWFIKNRQWTDMMVASHRDDNPMWRHVGYILAQLDGLLAGYQSASTSVTKPLDKFAVSFLNGMGDLMDLLEVFDPDSMPDWRRMSHEDAWVHFNTHGHCSALVKLLPGFENIFLSHSTWFSYQATNRIFKHYNLNVTDPNSAAKKISFSSYPGFLVSIDDFYILGSGMVMLQTSLDVYDESLYDKVTVDSLFAWQRVRVANMMAHNGEEWTNIIKKYNSGTYNNEYLVVDLKRFTPNQPLLNGTLWVADQIPGLVVAGDVTDILRDGYFPSYNVPYFEEIFVKSGNAAFVKTHGLDFSYDLAPRAKIFRRDHSKVTDMEGMKNIMRYNDYKNDPYSKGSPYGAVCGRGDLMTEEVDSDGCYDTKVRGDLMTEEVDSDGCYDTKVTDFSMAQSFQASIINGPTLDSNLPPFAWDGRFANITHVGLPPIYNFDFINTQPRFP